MNNVTRVEYLFFSPPRHVHTPSVLISSSFDIKLAIQPLPVVTREGHLVVPALEPTTAKRL